MKKLTDLTPMIPKRNFAVNIRNIACNRPRIAPITSAVDAEGTYRLSPLDIAFSLLFLPIFTVLDIA